MVAKGTNPTDPFPVSKKSIAMNKLFSEKTLITLVPAGSICVRVKNFKP
jgi:hypothetical protein